MEDQIFSQNQPQPNQGNDQTPDNRKPPTDQSGGEGNQSQGSPPDPTPQQGSSVGMILVVILAALIAGGAVWAYYNFKVLPDLGVKPSPISVKKQTKPQTSPATIDTKDWKTYTNKKYDFSIKYPKNWYVTEDTDGEGEAIITNFKYPAKTGGELSADQTKRVIWVKQNPSQLSVEKFFKKENPDSKVLDKETIEITGVEAIKYEVKPELGTKSVIIEIPHGKLMVEIVSMESDQYLDEMLLTFQFTS